MYINVYLLTKLLKKTNQISLTYFLSNFIKYIVNHLKKSLNFWKVLSLYYFSF